VYGFQSASVHFAPASPVVLLHCLNGVVLPLLVPPLEAAPLVPPLEAPPLVPPLLLVVEPPLLLLLLVLSDVQATMASVVMPTENPRMRIFRIMIGSLP
jgi:hypothetical protein